MNPQQSLSWVIRQVNRYVPIAILTFCILPVVAQTPAPPPTRQDNVKDVIHGVEILDPYRWLEDPDSPETKKWVVEQNNYAHSLLDTLPMRPSIQKRIAEMYRHDSLSGATKHGEFYFFYKRKADEDLWSSYRRKISGGPDELLLDPLPMSPDHTTNLQMESITFDGKLLAYAVRHGGEDETEIHVLDIDRHHELPDVLPRDIYTSITWKRDKSGFFYGVRHRGMEPKIYFHALGTDAAKDPVLFANGFRPDVWLTPQASEDGRYLLAIAWTGWTKSEIYLKDLTKNTKFAPLITGMDANFDVHFAGNSLIVRTDWNAPNFRMLKIDLRHPQKKNWREIVPEAKDHIENASVIGKKIFVEYQHDVASRIAIFSIDGGPEGEVRLPALGSASISGRWGEDEGFLYFSSFTTPDEVYRYSSSTGGRRLWYRVPVKFDPDRYEVEQVWYSSKDGTRVPMFLVHLKGIKRDGNRPVLLYGYGGFDVSLTPSYDHAIALWAEHGGIYAVANIRGGSEFGEAWHRAGMLEKKQNVFDDFIGAAEWLTANHYTNPTKLAIWGGSNGGLLVGAVLTQRPDLFRAVICDHPDLDIVRYPKLTKHNSLASMLEYGNADDPEQFKFIYQYSPYQHVIPGTKYPAVLITSGDEDTRVPPEQARKMAARLQADTASGLPVMLLYDLKAGHSGGRPMSLIVEEIALKLSFVTWQLDMH